VSVSAVRPRPRPRSASSGARVRWDRLARIALLCVLGALLYLYASAGSSLLSTWKEARQDSSQVALLQRQHVALEAQHAALTSPGTLVEEARRLGMMRPGEQTYVISGLPGD
jgi:cell division protein FtsB